MSNLERKIKSYQKTLIFALPIVCIALIIFASQVARAEWQEPELSPPQKGIPAPITVGGESQAKEGYLELNPEYNPTDEDSLIFDPQKPLHVKGSEGALFSSPYIFNETLAVDTDTLYVDALNVDGWVGIGTTVLSPGKRLTVVNGTVRRGSDLTPLSGLAVSAYSNTVGIYGEADVGAIAGVYGLKSSSSSVAVRGVSQNNVGVRGESVDGTGIYATNNSADWGAVFGQNLGTGWAGYFEGNLGAGGDIVTNSFLPTQVPDSIMSFTSGQQVAEYDFGIWTASVPNYTRMVYDGKYIWIGSNQDDSPGSDRTLFKVRASDGLQVGSYRVGWSVAALTWDGRYLWILEEEGAINRFDPKTDTYTTIPSSDTEINAGFGAAYLAVSTTGDQTYIWAMENNNAGEYNLVRIKADAEAPFADDIDIYDLTSSTLIPGNPVTGDLKGLVYDGQYIWVSSKSDSGHMLRLWAEDPSDAAHPGIAVDTNNGSYKCLPHGVVFDGEYVWCTPSADPGNQLVRIWAEDPNDPLHPIQGFGSGLFEGINVKGAVTDGQYLWAVTLQPSASLHRFLLADPNQVVTYNNVATDPYRIIFDGTYLWMADTGVTLPKLRKIFSGTGYGHTDLNSVVNLRTQTGQCKNPSDPGSSSNLQCVFNWHCPEGTGNPAPPPGGVAIGANRSGYAYDTAVDATYMYTVGRSRAPSINWYVEKRSLADSSLDTSFGSDGVIIGPGESFQARAIAIDSTYMYVVGDDSDPDFRIEKRSLSDGSLDTSFGTNGVALGTSNSITAMDIAIDSTYMYVVGGTEQGRVRIEKRLLSDGSYDDLSGFGGAGSDPEGVITGPSGSGGLTAIAIDSTFMYVIGGDSNADWRIEKRYLSDGSLDATFGVSGIVTGAVESRLAYDIAIDATYMYIVGADHSIDWRIEKRYLTDGSYDTSFGVSGVATSETVSNIAYALSIDSTFMYLIGQDSLDEWRIEKRYLTDGSYDTTFGTNGVEIGAPESDIAYGIAIDATYMYIVGTGVAGTVGIFRTEKRSLSDGAPDTDFGRGELNVYGVITGASESNRAYDVAIDSTYMYVVGRTEFNFDWRIEKRSLTDGDLDDGFGTNGVVTSTVGSYEINVAIDTTYMYVVGSTDSPNNWRIEKRLLSDGSFDTSFGTNGVITGPSESSIAYDVAIDATYMYVVGRTDGGDWYTEKRLLSDGSYDTSFGTGGAITSTSESFIAEGIAIDATYMYVAGYTDFGAGTDTRIEKRLLSDGSLDTSFGTNGVVTSASESSYVYAIAIDSVFMYVVGAGNPWRIEKRALSDGSLDAGFGTSGVVDGNSFSFKAYGITVDATYMYVVGYGGMTSAYTWNIEKRLLVDGSLAAGFGGVRLDPEGVISGDVVTYWAMGIAIDSEAMYVIGSDTTSDWRIEKRDLTGGALFEDSFGDYTYGSDEVCNANNATQSGNINIGNSAELFNNYCYSPGLNEHYYDSPCTSDPDCSGGQICAGGDLQVDGDIEVVGNTWQAGTEQIVGVAGDPKTAECPAGTFMKGINIVAGKLDDGSIICQGL